MRRILFIVLMIVILPPAVFPPAVTAQMDDGTGTFVSRNRVLDDGEPAPDFSGNFDWINAQQPQSIHDYRGKLLLLVFWSHGSAASGNVLADIYRLQQEFSYEVAVVGIHSAAFPAERALAAVRGAVFRNGIRYPVINDKDCELLKLYSVETQPSVFLLNPEGRIIARSAGVNVYDELEPIIAKATLYFTSKGDLKRKPIEYQPDPGTPTKFVLSFPADITVDDDDERLFITDAGNNRIIVMDFKGVVLDVIGSGTAGSKDGAFDMARFDGPQGTFYEDDILYIADTDNHRIRMADFDESTVTTLMGDGRRRSKPMNSEEQSPSLNAPRDLVLVDDMLYVTMAGVYQIWAIDPDDRTARNVAGSGVSGWRDGAGSEALLTQPSGIAAVDEVLYFTDSDAGAVRMIDLDADEITVRTLIGKGPDDIGDVDGRREQARLQYPTGISADEHALYIADTYNSKIKVLDFQTGSIETLAGTGYRGSDDGLTDARFNEPVAVVRLGTKLLVADRNNHLIRIVTTETGEVQTHYASDLRKLAGHTLDQYDAPVIELPRQIIGPGSGSISFQLQLPDGYRFSPITPSFLDWESRRENILMFTDFNESAGVSFPYEIAYYANLGRTLLVFNAVAFFCSEEERICLWDDIRIRVPLDVVDYGSTSPLRIDVKMKRHAEAEVNIGVSGRK